MRNLHCLRNQPTSWEQLQIQIFCNKNRAQYPETKKALRQNLIWDCDVYSSTNVNAVLICTGLHGLSSFFVEILFWTSLSTGILFGDTIPKLNKALSKLRTQQLEYILLCHKGILKKSTSLKKTLNNSKNGRTLWEKSTSSFQPKSPGWTPSLYLVITFLKSLEGSSCQTSRVYAAYPG